MAQERADRTIPAASIPQDLDDKLRLCEGIVERMRVLQEQVDAQILENRRAAQPGPPHEAGPALRLASSSVLHWIAAALRPAR